MFKIISVRGHCEVYHKDKFFCSADTYSEAVEEIDKESEEQ